MSFSYGLKRQGFRSIQRLSRPTNNYQHNHIIPQQYHNLRNFHATSSNSFDFSLVPLLETVHTAVQSVHDVSGLSWVWIIPLSTFAVRTFTTLPVAILNRRRTQRQAELQPLLGAMTPIMKTKLAKVSKAQSNARGVDLTAQQIQVLVTKERRNKRVELFRRHKCQSWKSIVLLPSVQLPLWISLSMVFRAMCGWSNFTAIPQEPQFTIDSFLWMTNLVEPDPYGVLPLLVGAIGLANVEWNAINVMNRAAASSTGSAAQQQGPSVQKIVSNISRVGIMLFMTMAYQAPVAVCLYWISSGAFSFIQNILFDKFMPLRYVSKPSTTDFVLEHGLETVKIDEKTLQKVKPMVSVA